MTEETKQKLRDAGREDLIEIHEINQSGYAGVNGEGTIVDRRKYPNATPVQKNESLGLPEPKPVTIVEKFPNIIKCLVNSGGEPWEFDSKEVERLLEYTKGLEEGLRTCLHTLNQVNENADFDNTILIGTKALEFH